MKTFPDCYGTMFPNLARLKRRESLEGRALAARMDNAGTGAEDRTVELKQEAWRKCVECLDYQTCYDLSVAELLVNEALANTKVVNPWVGDYGRKTHKN